MQVAREKSPLTRQRGRIETGLALSRRQFRSNDSSGLAHRDRYLFSSSNLNTVVDTAHLTKLTMTIMLIREFGRIRIYHEVEIR